MTKEFFNQADAFAFRNAQRAAGKQAKVMFVADCMNQWWVLVK
jgi:hypothetical protein